MDIKSMKKCISITAVALSFVVLSACDTTDNKTTKLTAKKVAVAQALLDKSAGVSPLDYAKADTARTNCITTGATIDTASEISCYQDFLETVGL